MQNSTLDRNFSIYLDGLRFTAALLVLFDHATFEGLYTTQFADLFRPFGHDAVIIFFVLSGYVIAYSANTKDRTAGRYFVSRGARIYSVAAPAILMTIVLQYIGMTLYPAHFGHPYQFDSLWAYVPFYLSFGTDFWFLNENMLNNGPFWSLSYEVWYYVLFAAGFYLAGRRRIFGLLVILLLVGPRQWLLFPIWIAGVGLYWCHQKLPLKRGTARTLFVTSVIAYCTIKYFGGLDVINGMVNTALGGFPEAKLRYSQYFVGDYVTATLVLINIWSALYCDFKLPASAGKAIRLAASFTFSLYLFHMPLLYFYSVVLGTAPASLADFLLLLTTVLLTVIVLGMFTERRKHFARQLIMRSANAVGGVGQLVLARRPSPDHPPVASSIDR